RWHGFFRSRSVLYKTITRDGVTASATPYSAAAPAGVQIPSKGHCSQSLAPVLNGSTPRGTKIKVMMMPITDAVTVMVQDICQVPAAAAMADRMTGPTKFARLNIWVISPMTADGEPPS